MNLKSCACFYKKYKLYIGLAILTAMIMVSFIFEPFWYAASAMVVLFFLTCNFEEQICSILYLSLFSGVSQIYIVAIIFCFLHTFVRYIIDLKKKRKPFFAKPFILTTVFLILFTAIHGKIDIEGFYNWALVFCLFYFVYLLFIYYKEINIKRSFRCLFVAVVVSCAIAAIVYPTKLITSVVMIDNFKVHRLQLFTMNINHLAMSCLFFIAYKIYDTMHNLMKNTKDLSFLKDKQVWINIAEVVVCFVVGLLTMSKAFMVMICFFALYVLIFLIYKIKAKSLYIIIPFLIICGILGFVFRDFVMKLFSRFFIYTSLESKISIIFTGRTDIWQTYRDAIRGSIINMLFGVGLLTKDIVAIGPHNVLIYFIYRFGFVGLIMMCTICYLYFKSSSMKIKITYTNCLLFLTYLILALEEMIFSDRFILYLVFGIILMLVPKQKSEEILIEDKSENVGESRLKNNDANIELEKEQVKEENS